MNEDLIRQAEEYYNMGMKFVQVMLYSDAIECFNKSAELFPTFECYQNRGGAYRSLGNYDEAISDYNQALTLDPNNVDALDELNTLKSCLEPFEHYFNISTEELEKQNFEKALDYTNKMLEVCPGASHKSVLYNYRGLIHAILEHKELAIKDFWQAIDSYIGNVDNYICLVMACLMENEEKTPPPFSVVCYILAALIVKKQGGDVYAELDLSMRKFAPWVGMPEVMCSALYSMIIDTALKPLDNILIGADINELILSNYQRLQEIRNNQSYIEHSGSRKLDL